jgi:thiol-disulfide isomerase/thioredoxin
LKHVKNSFNNGCIGHQSPHFVLPDTVSGKDLSLENIKGEIGTMIMFICNHCPFVKHVNAELVRLANDYKNKGIGFVAISSNDVINHPDDAPELMTQVAKQLKYHSPIYMTNHRKQQKPIMPPALLIFLFMIRTFTWFIVDSWMIVDREMKSL